MIPVILRNAKLREVARGGAETVDDALRAARIEGATVLGFVSAIGACGGYLIPRAFGASIKATGSVAPAFGAFVAFYATCIGLTWVCYLADQGRKVHASTAATPPPGSEAQV
jgi:NNP family nitrate/nitrite transporter-like MFS transporter